MFNPILGVCYTPLLVSHLENRWSFILEIAEQIPCRADVSPASDGQEVHPDDNDRGLNSRFFGMWAYALGAASSIGLNGHFSGLGWLWVSGLLS